MTMEEILTSGLAELGVPTTAAQLSQLRAYYTLLDERSKVMNLTAIEGEEATARLHFLDSAALLRYVRLSGKAAADIGSGAGFPGLVAAILAPDADVTLIDSLQKRVTFQQEVCDTVGLGNVTCLAGRAEEESALRESFEVVTSRAVARMTMLCELCLPLVRVGGVFAAMKGPEPEEEVQEAAGLPVAWCDLGGGLLWDQKEAYTLDLPKEAAAIREAFERTVPAAGREQMEIRTQLGRFLAAPCGLLLATVRGVKDSWVGVDASMADLPRACLAGVQYHVSLLGSIGLQGRSSRFLSGRSTDSLDHFGRRLLPPVSPGDILVFHGAGAYSRSMASNYGGSLRCPEILLEDGVPRLIRRREVVEDLLPGLL